MLPVGGIFLLLTPAISAETPDELCLRFKNELDAYPHLENTIYPDTFEHLRKSHAGCAVKFKSKHSALERQTAPRKDLTMLFYPSSDTAMHKEGWRASYETGGAGATGYAIARGNTLCVVSWYFNAGIDEDTGNYVAGDDLHGHVSCAVK